MAQQAYPSLNDIAPSWADIALTVGVYEGAVLEVVDFKGVKWGRTVEVGEQKGASGGRVMARTTGDASFEASATFYRSGYRKLLEALAEKAPLRGNQKRVGLVGFDILIQHTPPGEARIYQTKIKGCRLLGDSDDMAEGTDADTIEITLNPIEIVNIIDGEEIVLI